MIRPTAEELAQLVGRLDDAGIATHIGVHPRTVLRWRREAGITRERPRPDELADVVVHVRLTSSQAARVDAAREGREGRGETLRRLALGGRDASS